MQETQGPLDGSAQPASSGLLSADQVQALLDVDRSTIYRMASDGRLPAVKIGRQWRFPADRIRTLLEVGLSPETPPPARRPRSNDATPTLAAGPSPEGEPVRGAHHPVLSSGIVEPVLDVAAEVLGVMMVVTDMQGRPVSHIANPAPRLTAAADDPDVISACTAEWRAMADDLDFEPRFQQGPLGFECARAFIRAGTSLIGMVLAGGVAPADVDADDLYDLPQERRAQVLASLPKVAAALSRAAARTDDPRTSDGRRPAPEKE